MLVVLFVFDCLADPIHLLYSELASLQTHTLSESRDLSMHRWVRPPHLFCQCPNVCFVSDCTFDSHNFFFCEHILFGTKSLPFLPSGDPTLFPNSFLNLDVLCF